MTLIEFAEALLTVLPDAVFHNEAYQVESEYVVWGETAKISLKANDGKAEAGYVVGLDFFTKDEFSDIPDELEELFEKNDIAYQDVEIIYDEEHKETHYAYTLEVI